MRRELPGGYELDDDLERVDVDAVHAYITHSYWAKGRSREKMEAAIAGSARVIGAYHGSDQVGFARVISDATTYAYLADVYVLDDHRGKGLGLELVREAVDTEPWSTFSWHLRTSDAHELYKKFGFRPPSERSLER
ncbi:MAG TPA: GNAT family N-acetyltransferase [Thermoleophilaceae bacterium]|nr:GNAT family N-acetyltransferase [Thermoleophilaceae bacterium]